MKYRKVISKTLNFKVLKINLKWHLLSYLYFTLFFHFYYVACHFLQSTCLLAPAFFSAYYFMKLFRPFKGFSKEGKLDKGTMLLFGFFMVVLFSTAIELDMGIIDSDKTIFENMRTTLGPDEILIYPIYYFVFLVISWFLTSVLKFVLVLVKRRS